LLSVCLTLLCLPALAYAGGTVGHVRYAIDSSATFPSNAQTAARHDYVILHAWQQDRLRALKAANPNIRVLVIKNLSFSIQSTSTSGFASTGVKYSEADSAHPEWFLLNRSGQRFTSHSYGYLWAMDVGSASYQQRWADNVIAELISQGWDGVFMDDVNPTMKYHYDVGSVAKYPSDAAYSAATRSALAAIGPRVRAAGKLAVANIGSWSEYSAVGNGWLQLLDGAMEEMFLKWGNSAGQGYGGTGRWDQDLRLLKEADRQNKIFLAITHSGATDVQAARYGYATMLLGSNGRGYFALAQDYTSETWFPEYDYDLGDPTAAETADASGVHRRRFERGLVLVNPTASSQGVSFERSYSGSGLTNATAATMPPYSGLILTLSEDSASPSPPSGTTTSLEAETMLLSAGGSVFSDIAASGGEAVLLAANGTATAQHMTMGARTLVVRARGDKCRGAPSVVVTVDGQRVLATRVSSSSWTNYSVDVELADELHSVSVRFPDDNPRKNCSRGLRVDNLTFVS